MLFSSSFKKIVSAALVLVNLAYPIAATAGQYMGMVSVKDLIVTNGELPPVVNIDTSNTTSNTFRAGGAVIKVAPGTIAYGIVTAGNASAQQTVTLSNLGSSPAQLGSISSGSQFTATKTCDGVTLPALGTCQVNIAFTPTQVTNLVTENVIIPFTSGTSSAQAVVHVSGTSVMPEGPTALIPAVALTSPPDAFPLAIINQQSFTKTFTVNSIGNAPLNIQGIQLVGNDGSFKFESTCSNTLAPTAKCDISVTFEPKTIGSKSAQLQIDTNAFQKNSVVAPLLGEAIEIYPVYGAGSTNSVDFGSTTIAGAANVVRTVTIANSGTAGLHPTFSLDGAYISGVSITNNGCQAGVPAGGTCTVDLVLSAASPTVILGQLVVTHDGKLTPASPVLIPISGEIIPQSRILSFNPSISFGNVDVDTAASQTITITNQGNSSITGVTATAGAPVTVSGNTCAGLTLQPGAQNSCEITFSLTHAQTGPFSRTGSLSAAGLTATPAPLTFNATLQTRTIAAVAPSSLDFGLASTQIWSDSQAVTVTNTGTARVSPRIANREASTGVISTTPWIRVISDTCSAGIVSGASCSFQVQVKPSLSSAMSATVTVYPDTDMATQGKTFNVTAQGNPQSYNTSVNALDFGTVGSLQTVDRTITFTNTSPAGTSVTGFSQTITQPDAGSISVSSNTCATLAPQSTCAVTYRYTAPSYPSSTPIPVTGGAINAYFTGARASAQVFSATSTLVGSDVVVSNDGTDFGATPVGKSAATVTRKVSTLTNTGTYPVTISTISVSPNTLQLTEDLSSASACIAGQILAAGATCTVTLYPSVSTYTGTSGTKSATLTVGLTDRAAPQKLLPSVNYSGTLSPVTLTTDFTAMDFGVIGENTSTSKTFTYTVSHGGGAYLTLGLSGTKFSASSTCQGAWIPAGTQCTVTLTAEPGAFSGNTSGVVTVYASTEGVQKPLIVGSLFAQVEAMSLTVEQNDLSFGDIPSQTAGFARYAVLKNSSEKGIATITLGTGYPTGTNSLIRNDSSVDTFAYNGQDLKACAYGKLTLAPGELCYLKFQASGNVGATASSGAYSGTTSVATNTTAGSISIPLSANFLSADIAVSTSSINFETPTPSASAHTPDKTVSVTNTGTGRLWLATQSFTVSGNFNIVKSNNSLVKVMTPGGGTASSLCELRDYLDPGQSCDVTVRFIPQGSAGPRTGALTLNANAPVVVTKTVALSGEALAAVVYVNAVQDMGSVLVGSSVTKSFVIGNGGNTPLKLVNFGRASTNNSAVANHPTEFTAAHNCPASIASGDECVVNITFAPDQNLNWGSLTNKETFVFESFTNGSWQVSQVALTGVGYGSELTSNVSTIPLGLVEAGNVSQDLDVTVTYTASGLAPVRITDFVPSVDNQLTTKIGGTCSTGMTLQPGGTCTVKVTNSTNFTGYSSAVGTTYDRLMPVMAINGSYYANGALVSNKSAQLKSTMTVANPASVTFVNPNAVHNTETTAVTIYGANFRPGISATIAGEPVEVSYRSTAQIVVTVPLGLPLGDASVTLKNTDGLADPVQAAVTVVAGVTLTSPLANVYTIDPGQLVTSASESVLDEAVLQDGRKLVLVSTSATVVLRLLDSTGVQLTQTSALGSVTGWYSYGLTPVSGSLVVSGDTIKFASLVSETYQYCAGGVCNDPQRSLGVVHGETTLSANSLGTPTYGNISITGLQTSPSSVSGGVSIASLDAKKVIAYQATVNGNSYAAVKIVTGTTVTSTAAVTGIAGIPSAVGVARNLDTVYVRHGTKIRAYDVSTGQLSLQSEYVYANELTSDSAQGIVYSPDAAGLVTSCYAGTVLCAIPAVDTALGSAAYLAGSNGVAGYVDGDYLSARFSASKVSQGEGNLVLVRQGTNPKALRAVQVPGAANGAVQISATAIDFGNVSAQSTVSATAMLMNLGSTEVSLLSAPALSGANVFSMQGTTCQSTLLPGQSCTVSLNFSPTSQGASTGALSFATNFGTVSSNLTGTGVANPQITVDTADLAFGAVAMSGSSSKTLTISNTGNVALSTVSAILTGARFSTSNNCPATLAVGATCQVTVVFSPNARQDFSADITVGYTGASAQVTHLTGTGVAPLLSVDAPSQNFGTVGVGQVASRTVTLTNSGNADATLSFGSLPATFSRADTCEGTLAANSSCTVTVNWAPVAKSTASASLSVSASNTSVTVALSGSAVPEYSFTKSAVALNFGTLTVPNASTQSVVITNDGSSALTGGTFLIKGVDTSEYSVASNCPTSLAPGANCTVSVTLTASHYSTSRTGYLEIKYPNVAASTVSFIQTVNSTNLTTGGTQSFGNIAVGSTGSATWTVTNTGNMGGALTFNLAGLPSQVTKTGGTCGTALAASASCTVTLKYTPTSTISVTGALNISSLGSSTNLGFIGYGPVNAAISVSATSLAWGTSVAVGGTSSQSFVLTNSGNVDLSNPSFALTSNTTDYSVTSDCPTTITAGAACTVMVAYAPTNITGTNGTLTVSYSGATSKAVTLTGTGQGALNLGFNNNGSTSVTSNFGAVAVGSSGTASQTFYNSSSNQTVTFEWGELPAYLVRAGSCASTLAAGTSCTVTLTYRPTATVQDTGTFTFTANGRPFNIAYIGHGTVTQLATVTPATLAFGTVARYSSTTLSTTFKNTGTGPITNPQFAITGAASATKDYAIASSCPVVLNAGESCLIDVTYSPQGYFGTNATLSASYAGVTVASVSLTQTLATPVLSTVANWQPSTMAPVPTENATTLTAAALGASANTTLTVYNAGTDVSSIGISGSLDPQVVITGGTCLSGAVAKNGSCTVIVTYTPTSTNTVDTAFLVSDAYTTLVYRLKGVPTTPTTAFTLSTSAIAYGAVAIGQTAQQIVTITNTGNTHLSTVNLGATGNEFSLDGNDCPPTLFAGSTCNVAVSYTPKKYAAASGTLTVKFNGAPAVGTKTVTLTGTTSDSNLSFNGSQTSPTLSTTLNVGSTTFGTTSAGSTVTLYNNTAAGAIANFSYGALPPNWSMGAGTCNTGTLAVGANCTIIFKYTANDRIASSDQFIIYAPNRTLTVNLNAFGAQNASGAGASTVSLTSMAFGAVPLGTTSATQSVVFKNASAAAVSNPAVSVTSGSGAEFPLTTDCPVTLGAGATCTVYVSYRPSSYGGSAVTGTLSINYANLATKTVSLSGTPAYASLTTPSAGTFTATTVGVAKSLTFTVTSATSPTSNVSTTLTLNDTQLPAQVTRTGGTCAPGTVLAPGGSCTVILTYTPTEASTVQGFYEITSSAGNSILLGYSGTATYPTATVTLSAASLAFGTVSQGSDGGSKSILVTNTGTTEVSYPSITLAGNSDMHVTHNCPVVLAPSATCVINVAYTPAPLPKMWGNGLGLTSNFSSPLVVNYRGATQVSATVTGSATAMMLTTSTGNNPSTVPPISASINFGTVMLGNNVTSSVSITNGYLYFVTGTGTSTWYYSTNTGPITYSDNFPAGVTRLGTCGATLAAVTSCTLSLNFAPTQLGDISGVLTVQGPNSVVYIPYYGTAVAKSSASVSTTAIAFGNKEIGTTETRSFLVTNTGLSPVSNPNISYTGNFANYSTTTDCPATLEAGASCTVNVTYAPVDFTSSALTLSVGYSNTATSTVTVTGAPVSPYLSVNGGASKTTSVSFGAVAVGASSNATVTVYNSGANATAPANLTLSGLPPTITRTGGTCSDVLVNGSSCTYVLTYTPLDLSTTRGVITVGAQQGQSLTYTFAVTATGTPTFAVSTTSMPFGSNPKNTTSEQSVTITNTGALPMSNPSAVISGNVSEYSASSDCPITLGVGESCTATVYYTPTTTTGVTGTLTVGYTGATSRTVLLTGTGY